MKLGQEIIPSLAAREPNGFMFPAIVCTWKELNGSNVTSYRLWLQCAFAIYAVCMFSLLCLVGRKKHLCLSKL